NAQLMLSSDSRIHGDLRHTLHQFRIAHAVQLKPDDNGIPRLKDAEFMGDGTRCVRMIAGDHHDAHASALTPLDRITSLEPWRVLQADQPQECQTVLMESAPTAALAEPGNWSSGRSARASTRNASLAICALARSMRARSFSVSASTPWLVRMAVQRARMTSGAPFVKAQDRPLQLRMTVMHLRSESKGSVP